MPADPTIDTLAERDYPELLSFLDRCYAPQARGFDTLLPARFADPQTCTRCNYGLRQDGKLLAVAAIYPIQWQVGGTVLSVAGVGNVGVDPDRRGQGLMTRLLSYAVGQMPGRGFDLSWLGGYRQRYARFGYEKAGVLQQFMITPGNLGDVATDGGCWVIRPMPPEPDEALVRQLKALHDAQPTFCQRSLQEFPHHLRNWRREAMILEDPSGIPRGYAVFDQARGFISELVADSAETAMRLVKHIVRDFDKQVEVQCNAVTGPWGSALHAIAEHRYLTTNGNWLIFNWPKVLQALLQARHLHCPLPEGKVIISIAGQRMPLQIRVEAAGATCQWTDRSPDFAADALTVTRALLGPANPAQIVALRGRACMLGAWCPLPAGFGTQDYI